MHYSINWSTLRQQKILVSMTTVYANLLKDFEPIIFQATVKSNLEFELFFSVEIRENRRGKEV